MTESDVADAVRSAALGGGRVRVVGGGTCACAPRDGAAVLDVAPLRGITDLRTEDLVAAARAGTPLRDLDAALRECGARLPFRVADDGRATLGGAVAAAADGLTAREGFRWRDTVLAVRCVLGDGTRVGVGAAVVKSVAGFDVAKALVGSRGTLAVLTEITVRVEAVPAAAASWRRACAAGEVADAVAAADGLAFAPRGIVVTPSSASSSAAAGAPPAFDVDVLLEGPGAAVEAAGTRLARCGFRREDDAEARWQDLTRRASFAAPAAAPDTGTLGRRRGVVSRRDPSRHPAASCPGFVADVLRRRATWADDRPPPPPDPAAAAILARIVAAFDPGGVLQPGRGFGAP